MANASASSRALGSAVFLAVLGSPAAAQSRMSNVSAPVVGRVIEAARTNAPIRIDGRLDEAVWRSVRPATQFVQRDPAEGAAATQPTEVRMVITDDAVVIAAHMHDQPDALHATLSAQPSKWFLSDYFQVEIDAHREHLTALSLAVTPAGARAGGLMARDGSIDSTWNVRWQSATHVDSDGWTAEIRIPLSEFHVTPGTETWGVQFVRFSWARQETDVLRLAPTRVADAK